MEIVILFLDDYGVLKEGLDIKDTILYILHGSSQNVDNTDFKETIKKAKSTIYIPLDDPDDSENGLKKIQEQLEQEKKIDKIFLCGKNHKKFMFYIRESLPNHNVVLQSKGSLKRTIDTERNKNKYKENKDNRKDKDNEFAANLGSSVNSINTQKKKSYKANSDKTPEEEAKEKNKQTINREITAKVTSAKRQLINAITDRLQFHLHVLTKSKFSKFEVIELMELMAKLPPKENWAVIEKKEWSLKAEREKILESWRALQGNKAIEMIPTGEEKGPEKLKKITEDGYDSLKKEMIYYYNLSIFLYNEDHWC